MVFKFLVGGVRVRDFFLFIFLCVIIFWCKVVELKLWFEFYSGDVFEISFWRSWV